MIKRIKKALKKVLPPPVDTFRREIDYLRNDFFQEMKKQQKEIVSAINSQSNAFADIITDKTEKLLISATKMISEKTEAQSNAIIEIINDGIGKQIHIAEQQTEAITAIKTENEKTAAELQKSTEIYLSALQETRQIYNRMQEKIDSLEWQLNRRGYWIEMGLVHCIPRAELSFEVALAEHCDLNCAGCDHFSPLAEPEFADFQEMTNDFKRLSQIFDGKAREIHLLGGEPLLHPDVTSFFKLARDCFPTAAIDLTTNALKLLHQPEEFWQACRENNIIIRPTKYPIPLDFEEIEKKAVRYQVEFRYINDAQVVKTLDHYKLDIQGLQDGTHSFLICHRANTCIYLSHGRLYTCTVAPTVRHFNKYFGTDLKVLPEDSIDIYEKVSAKEILNFLARPIPFCRYCMPDKLEGSLPWKQSERKIEEWT